MTAAASVPEVPSLSASATIPFKPISSSDVASFSGSWMATVVLLALVVAMALLLRKRLMPAQRASGKLVVVVETIRLSERTRLSVVRYRNRELLIAHGDQPTQLLADQPPGEPPGEAP